MEKQAWVGKAGEIDESKRCGAWNWKLSNLKNSGSVSLVQSCKWVSKIQNIKDKWQIIQGCKVGFEMPLNWLIV